MEELSYEEQKVLAEIGDLANEEPEEQEKQEEIGRQNLPDFQRARNRYKNCQTNEIVERLKEIKSYIDESGGKAESFTGLLVTDFIAAHLVLNERVGLKEDPAPAPAFRPQPIRTRVPRDNARVLSNCVRFIDLHFCWSMGHRLYGGGPCSTIFQEKFGYEQAFAFIQTPGAIPKKLELLCLGKSFGPKFCRFGCASLMTAEDRDHRVWFTRQPDRILAKLQTKHLRPTVDPREWSDVVTAALFLKRIGIEPNGHDLMHLTNITGRYVSDRPARLMDKLEGALSALSAPRKRRAIAGQQLSKNSAAT
jgi:hypothetical protein